MSRVRGVGHRAAAWLTPARKLVGMGAMAAVFGLTLVQALPADARGSRTCKSRTALSSTRCAYALAHGALLLGGAQYAALGDSYASGEGSFSYLRSSNTLLDRCHRATSGYAEQLSAQFSLSLGFAACSGAIISDLYLSNVATARLKTPPELGFFGEHPQFSVLGPNTRLVTLSIGGNDAGFYSVLKDCVSGRLLATGSYGCEARDQSSVEQNISELMDGRPAGCAPYAPNANPGNNTDGFCGAEPSLQTVYDDIAALAPNAAIYVIGYPHLFGSTFNNNGVCDVGGVGRLRYTIAGSDVAWMDSEADLVDQDIQSSVAAAASATGRSITFVDPRSTFAGHGVCDSGARWINALVLPERPESFHPNTTGQQMLANLISQTILGVGQS